MKVVGYIAIGLVVIGGVIIYVAYQTYWAGLPF
jgi:hypothetical protein